MQLFSDTIKTNIARMREDVSDAEIYQADQLADVHEMNAGLPHSYKTFVNAKVHLFRVVISSVSRSHAPSLEIPA